MRNNVVKPAKQFIARYGEQACSKAREAQRAARKQGKGQLATFYAKVAEWIENVSAQGHVEGRATRSPAFAREPAAQSEVGDLTCGSSMRTLDEYGEKESMQNTPHKPTTRQRRQELMEDGDP
jgi:hypothetical protein